MIQLMVVCVILAIVAAIAVPVLNKAKMAANESGCIAACKLLLKEQENYKVSDGENKRYAMTLMELWVSGCVEDDVLAAGRKAGYFYTLNTPGITDPQFVDYWNVQANPVIYGKTGTRYFFVDPGGVIRFNTITQASPNDSPVD